MKCMDCGGYRWDPKGYSILWVGPGMGDYFHRWWADGFIQLFDNGFRIEHLRSIDLKGAPKRFFNPKFSPGLTTDFVEENLRENFFHQEPEWDIIIIDFIEAWLRGNDYWPTFADTPYRAILYLWREKILELRPKQVWVVHDNDPHSTIIPDLSPEYELVDIGLKPFFPGKGLKDISIWQLS